MVVSALFFGAVFFLVPLVLFFFLSKKKSPMRMGALLGIIHFCLVLALAVFIYVNIAKDGETVMLFLVAYGLDLPVSLATVPISVLADQFFGSNFMLNNFWIPAVVFMVLGSLQYFLIGLGLGHLLRKLFPDTTHQSEKGLL